MRSLLLPHPFPAVLALLLVLAVTLGAPIPSPAEIVRDPLWITDGEVRCVAYTNNTIFIGGQFSGVGPPLGGAATFDAGNGATIPPYWGVAGTVHAIVPDGAGGYYLGGAFTGVKGQPRNNLAQVDASGNVTPWNPDASAEVYTLAVGGPTVYAGGAFDLVGGQNRAFLAEIDAATGAVTSWAPQPNGPVKALAFHVSSLLVGGSFHSIAGQTRHLVASFQLASGSLHAWAPNGDTSGGSVNAIGVFENTIYLGGGFIIMGGQIRGNLAAVDATTGLATSWNPNVSGAVYAIAVTQVNSFPSPIPTVWIGGDFTQVGGSFRLRIAGIDAAGSPLAFNPGANALVRTLRVRTSQLGVLTSFFAGGDFTTIAGVPRAYIASLNSSGGSNAWSPNPTGPVHTIVFGEPGTIVAGGAFVSANMTTRANIAALDATSGLLTPWNPGADGPVNALLVHGTSLYVGGAFSLIATDGRSGAAEIDLYTLAVTPWNPVLACTDFTCSTPTVYAITRAASSNIVFLGGSFRDSWSQFRRNIVASDGTTGAPLPFNVNANFAVRAIALRERDTFPFDVVNVYAGGDFNTVNAGLHGQGDGGVIRHGLAALDGATGEALSWNPSTNLTSKVNSLTFVPSGLPGAGTVWMGGSFPTMGGQTRNNAAAVDAGTALATGWDPNTNGTVRAMLLRGGTVFLGGDFTSVGGQPRNRIASVSAADGAPSPWDPDANGNVLALATHGGTIFAGGAFTRVSNHAHPFFAGIGDGTVTGVETAEAVTPSAASVVLASPNPFRDRMMFRFRLPRREEARVDVYDVAGRLVRTLHRGLLDAGEHALEWDGKDAAERAVGSGIYFLRAEAPSAQRSAKVFRLR